MDVAIEDGPDDRIAPGQPPKKKSYLVVQAAEAPSRRVIYCHTPKPGFKELLMKRLSDD